MTKKISGICASPGVASGRALVIPSGMKVLPSKMKEGMILIVYQGLPQFVALYHKAKAIVTDQGGITSHAAVIARELKIPCLVSAQKATTIFKTGDLVEVDADKGLIKQKKV